MKLRRIKVGEGPVFRDIRLRALLDAPEAFKSSHASALLRSPESWFNQADTTASGSDRCTMLAFSGQKAVGIAALYRLSNAAIASGELLQVWVDPEYRGTGLAVKLVESITKWALENGYKDVIATVHVENLRVVGFYEKLGFYLDPEATAKQPPRDLVLRRELR